MLLSAEHCPVSGYNRDEEDLIQSTQSAQSLEGHVGIRIPHCRYLKNVVKYYFICCWICRLKLALSDGICGGSHHFLHTTLGRPCRPTTASHHQEGLAVSEACGALVVALDTPAVQGFVLHHGDDMKQLCSGSRIFTKGVVFQKSSH